ncbi:hypothetical protein BDV95DRAFT_598474 [Massariosphaeria phaeospora]|uniref:RING-type domain-containing protein n=1 Tax=Massariosphaeria phaeospora TaxID=100035 RepID=A0A7C8I041_9PLEO|nr:hypothetical protein BDV95DRAFT_598474 [Massariosphaeria phaeospora]
MPALSSMLAAPPLPLFLTKQNFLAAGLDPYSPTAPEECSICKELLVANPPATIPPAPTPPPTTPTTIPPPAHPGTRIKACNHVFGKTCLEAWLQQEDQSTCPMCRVKLFGGEVRRVSQLDGVIVTSLNAENIGARLRQRDAARRAAAAAARERFVADMAQRETEAFAACSATSM